MHGEEAAADGASAPGRLAACPVCPRACRLAPGQIGACRARVNRGGEVHDLDYGALCAVALDPVEKKPFAEWRSGKKILSVGALGCNLRCPFCQNADISQAEAGSVPTRHATPEQLVRTALDLRDRGNIGLAFTYNEPFCSFDFLLDAARAAKEAGLAFAVVSNAMLNPGALRRALPFIDAANFDLKGFSGRYYAACLGGGDEAQGERALKAVKGAIAAAAASPACHVEVTTLVVPGLVDADEMEEAARWLASIDPFIPYHVTQYHPAWRWHERPLPPREVRAYAEKARKHLNRVYTGNL